MATQTLGKFWMPEIMSCVYKFLSSVRHSLKRLRFKLLTAVNIEIPVIWDV